MKPSLRAQILLLVVAAVWGMTFVLVKDALRDVSPLLFNLLRMTLAAGVLAAINRQHLRQLNQKTLASGLIVGAFLAAGYQFQTAGLARTTAAKAAFITGFVVVFVPLLSAIPLLRPKGSPRPGPAAFFGAILAFFGLVLLTTPTGTSFTRIFATIRMGDLLILICALAFAGHLLALARASLHLPAGLIATIQIGAAALLMLLTLPLGGRPEFTLTGRLILALLITSLLATVAAFTIQSYAQQHLPPTSTALILTLEPVFAWLTSVVVLHEHLGPRAAGGALLILLGILVIEVVPGRSTPGTIPA